jgi:hypothetical protein
VLGAVVLAASTVSVVATTNSPPQFTSFQSSAGKILAGQSVTVSGTFTDPDATDAHTVMIYWKDGVVSPGQAEKIQLAPGQGSFQVSHTYPIAIPETLVHVRLMDRQLPVHTNDNTTGSASDSRNFFIQVDPSGTPTNVAPSFVESSIKVTKAPGQTGFVTIQGDWVDPNDDVGTVSFNAGDGLPPPNLPPCTSSGRHFKCMYTYRVPKPVTSKEYVFQLDVNDGHGGTDTYRSTIRIP